ncbi:MAG TPA: RraA family protein [Geobacteraceae bacterium]
MEKEKGASSDSSPLCALSPEQLQAILRYDTCTIANAIESFGVRLRNEGFTRPGLNCITSQDQRILGYAATFQVKSGDPPVTGGRFKDRTDWWGEMERLPIPRIAVFESLDRDDEDGSCVGDVHTAILSAFGCCGAIIDGSVRDVPGIRKQGFPVFARSVAVSHSYVHIVSFGKPVEVLGLKVEPGDLLYADCHGVLAIPVQIAAELPAVAERFREQDDRIIRLCRTPDFSPEKLRLAIGEEEPAA